VALATVRRVLGPVLVTGDGGVALATDRVDIDVESFLRDAAQGLRDRAAGRPGAATLLRRAAGAYRGDALEEELYADWAHGLREEARAACLAVLRALAADAADPDQAVLPLHRLLGHDPYDEPAHRLLVSTLAGAGRWGDARRAHGTYRVRMAELGLVPAAVPGLPAAVAGQAPGTGGPFGSPVPDPGSAGRHTVLRRSPGRR
jgi:DNA-binding SARP family transcriptional activator